MKLLKLSIDFDLPMQDLNMADRMHVQRVLREQVAPALELDGSEIEVTAVVDGIASVRMAGVCASCPASLPVVIMSMEQELRKYIPEVEVIEAVL
jgi:Fe-S cluster biogenesis protein NfuA